MPSLDTMGLLQRRWDWRTLPDLTGKVVIVTGGNAGVGFAITQLLTGKGATVYILCRSQARAREAMYRIKAENPAAIVKYIQFDLTSLASGKSAALEFLEKEQRLDILINNAGIGMVPYKLSKDGIEITACNATGHFALTIPLLPILKQTAKLPDAHVRIVNLSSDSHLVAKGGDFSTIEGLNSNKLSALGRYENSKLLNVLFNDRLQEELEGTGIRCLSVMPGAVATEFDREAVKAWPWLWPFIKFAKLFFLSPQDGALSSIYAAASPEVDELDLKAAFLIPMGRLYQKAKLAEDKELRDGFWALCERLVKEHGS